MAINELLPVNERLQKALNLKDPVKQIESDREFKAYIYQQLVDLQPYLEAESQISVLVQVEKNADTDSGLLIRLSLVATIGEHQVESDGQSGDMYEAFRFAKNAMLSEFEDYYNAAVDQSERDSEIRMMLSGAKTLH